MCGFAGFFAVGHSQVGEGDSEIILQDMLDPIIHRGPDDSGTWGDVEQHVWLGHRRLSIQDLSMSGHQPMMSASGRYVLVFNGEIYNHLTLRNQLASGNLAPIWRGHSDTETLLAGFEAWGIHETVIRAIGMFAFSVWDKKTQALTLGRDRIGEKPLYYGWQGNTFLFGSELKALKPHPLFEGRVNRGAISLLLRHGYIPAPHSIFQGINKLIPGCLLSISKEDVVPKIYNYWSASSVATRGVAQPFDGSLDEVVDELDVLAKKIVHQQMMADVPLGAFLSGGVDSSTIVALMQAQSPRPVKTFSIGFSDEKYNEAEYAKAVAIHLGTDHTELYVTPKQAMEVIPLLPTLYDEPFADSSQIPTFLVAQLAKQQVSVSLSGDGGDELFCGYRRYEMTDKIWRKLALMPVPLRMLVAKFLSSMSLGAWDTASRLLPKSMYVPHLGDRVLKAADVLALSSESLDEFYLGFLMSHHRAPASIVLDGAEPDTFMAGSVPVLHGLSNIERMMALDMMAYLPDDILVKVDRASMGVSLESRVPFLDPRIIEFAWHLPLSMKLNGGQSKWPLRQVLYRYVPRKLIERPKKGFSIPLHDWLRGPLREWSEALLGQSRLQKEGFFDPIQVRGFWEEHLSGRRNWSYLLWNILMFQAWLEAQ